MSKAMIDLSKKGASELEKAKVDAHLELMKLRAQLVTGAASKEVGKAHGLKKKIARIETLQRMGVGRKQ